MNCLLFLPVPSMPVFIVVESSKSFFLLYLLLSFCSCSPEASAEPVPPSPGRWSQDLLSNTNGYENLFIEYEHFFHPNPPDAELCIKLSFHQKKINASLFQ